MNKLFSILLCFVLSIGSVVASPNKQQSTDILKTELVATASSSGSGVLIEWRATNDVLNLGFDVFRIEGKKLVRINDEVVAGAAIVTAETAQSSAIHSYRYFDLAGAPGDEYVVETVSVNGERRQFGRFRAELDFSADRFKVENSKTLAELGRDAENSEIIKDAPEIPQTKEFAALQDVVQNAQTQRWVAAQTGAKIAINKDGFYRVTRAQLATTNFDLNAPVANWQLYADGIEQPIIVEPNGGFVEFYGRGIDTPYSDSKIYYLVAGSAPGKRIQSSRRRLNATRVAAPNFNNFYELKQRSNYSAQILNGETENFFGRVIVNFAVSNVTFRMKGIDASVPTTLLTVKVQGLSLVTHNIKVLLNNTEIGTMTGESRNVIIKEFVVPTSQLIDGDNTLGFQSQSQGDTSFFDTLQINYVRRYQADSNRLSFVTANARATRITGFTAANVRVFDISEPSNVFQVVAENDGSGNVFVPANRPRLMYALADGAQLSPVSVTANSPSNLLDAANNKDLVIITHNDFLAQAQNLADYRTGQGLTVAVANVEDVYDESSFGTLAITGIKEFLQTVRPRYVLLFGDSSYDPRNYLESETTSHFVPTKMFETLFGETYTDEFIADFDDDKVADIPVGRLPATNAATAQTMVAKISSFEATVAAALMTRGATFVSDNPDGYDYYASTQRLRNQLPATVPTDFIRRSDGDTATVRQLIVNRINEGRFIIAFSGHGTSSAWTGNAIFSTDQVSQLNNTQFNLFLPMNCLNGAFADPFGNSLSETMVRASNGGSVAAWSSSGLTFPDTQELMALRFFQALGSGEFARLGDATKAARLATPDPDVRQTWILLGDPSLKIK